MLKLNKPPVCISISASLIQSCPDFPCSLRPCHFRWISDRLELWQANCLLYTSSVCASLFQIKPTLTLKALTLRALYGGGGACLICRDIFSESNRFESVLYHIIIIHNGSVLIPHLLRSVPALYSILFSCRVRINVFFLFGICDLFHEQGLSTVLRLLLFLTVVNRWQNLG